MSAQLALELGEVTSRSSTISPLPCAVPGVTAQQATRRGGGYRVQERLYDCANGYSLGARRGGPLHLADKDTWEIFLLAYGVPYTPPSEAVGWVDEATLANAVRLLAEKPAPPKPAWMSA